MWKTPMHLKVDAIHSGQEIHVSIVELGDFGSPVCSFICLLSYLIVIQQVLTEHLLPWTRHWKYKSEPDGGGLCF